MDIDDLANTIVRMVVRIERLERLIIRQSMGEEVKQELNEIEALANDQNFLWTRDTSARLSEYLRSIND